MILRRHARRGMRVGLERRGDLVDRRLCRADQHGERRKRLALPGRRLDPAAHERQHVVRVHGQGAQQRRSRRRLRAHREGARGGQRNGHDGPRPADELLGHGLHRAPGGGLRPGRERRPREDGLHDRLECAGLQFEQLLHQVPLRHLQRRRGVLAGRQPARPRLGEVDQGQAVRARLGAGQLGRKRRTWEAVKTAKTPRKRLLH